MDIPRYYTVGAVVPDARSLKELGDRLEALDPEPDSVVVLALRRDQRLAQAVLPEARVRSVESGLSRRQWLEFASTFFSASTVSFLMGAVHLWTGFVVQAVLMAAPATGLAFYQRPPRVETRFLQFGMPDPLANNW